MEGNETPSGGLSGVSAKLRGHHGKLAACFVALALSAPGVALALIGSGSGLTIEVRPPGSGRVVGSGGIDCDDKCSYEVEGSETLTAIPNPGYSFKAWKGCETGGASGRKCTVMPSSGPRSIAATFVKIQTLSVAKAEGSGSGTLSSYYGIACSASCTSTAVSFLYNAKVTLKQTPAKHSHFVEWLGDCTGSGPCELTMDKDHDVEALFAADPKHTLTLTKVGDGRGAIKSKPAGIVCSYTCTASKASFYEDETVVLEAVANKGDTFEGWSGGGCSGVGACTVTMTEAREVVADFGPTFGGFFGGPCPPPKVCIAAP
ncbi:MAG TPA: hypothetical protein VF245_07915 [Solirubrobacterales bacterium]